MRLASLILLPTSVLMVLCGPIILIGDHLGIYGSETVSVGDLGLALVTSGLAGGYLGVSFAHWFRQFSAARLQQRPEPLTSRPNRT